MKIQESKKHGLLFIIQTTITTNHLKYVIWLHAQLYFLQMVLSDALYLQGIQERLAIDKLN